MFKFNLLKKANKLTKKVFGGHINNSARGFTALCTLGMSNLFWKKSKGTNKTKTINSTVGVCQNCGNTWVIKKGKMGSAPISIFR